MPLDFPNAPTVNQTYVGPNGVIWAWDGVKWVNGTQVGTAYAPVASPVFTGDPQAPTATAGDADTSIATTAFVSAAVATALHDTGRNLLHNPLFNIAQRGTGPFTVSGNYTLDRWVMLLSTDASGFSQVAASDSDRAAIGDEAATRLFQCGVAGNAGAGSFTIAQQRVEDARRLAGKTVTVSFYANAAAAIKIGVSVDQYFGTGGSPSAIVSSNGQSVSIPGLAWARYSLTFVLPSVAGKTFGTNNDSQTQLILWYSAGSTYATRAGNIGVQSGTVNVWGVQLEIGPVATLLEKPDPQQDLAKSQRFYQTGTIRYVNYAGGAGQGLGYLQTLSSPMRATPTLTPTYTAQTNCTGAVIAWDTQGIYIAATSVATGPMVLTGTYTASADL